MAARFGIVIAALPRFPKLGQAPFERGKMRYLDSVRRYLDTENALGTVKAGLHGTGQRHSSSG